MNIPQISETPAYYYDMSLLTKTIQEARKWAGKYNFNLHYALKANNSREILQNMHAHGLGADCVSGNEITAALKAGIPSDKIVFAGVGKTEKEMDLALEAQIFCFNCESLQEIEVLNERATLKGTQAKVALRINPDINAKTHKHISTGMVENKFGIHFEEIPEVMEKVLQMPQIEVAGLHFHIGSQIRNMDVFKNLCLRANAIKKDFECNFRKLDFLNMGGGLGVDYATPYEEPVPDFESYFKIFHHYLERTIGQEVHFEPGRSLVAQSGFILTRVLYVKTSKQKSFAVVDAGMTELIRPALYQSYHSIENLSSSGPKKRYDVVGPVCESADLFYEDIELPEVRRGDVLSIKSAGAYAEVMSSNYNLRDKAKSYYFTDSPSS